MSSWLQASCFVPLLNLPTRILATALASIMIPEWCAHRRDAAMFYLVNHAGASRAAVITYVNLAVAALLGVVAARTPGLGGSSRSPHPARFVAGDPAALSRWRTAEAV